ncbi:MAG: Flp/Fap pilin component [Acidobacteriota bacterium]|jgi:Flp pilus assembly pilin Flp
MQSQVAVAMLKKVAGVRRSDDGQDLLEYGLLAALIAIIALGAVTAVGNTISGVFWNAIAAASI